MIFDENQGAESTPEVPQGEGEHTEAETISLSKSDYEKMNQTLGALKRELKDLRKPKDEPRETPTKNQADQPELLQKTFLRAAQITAEDEVELALQTAKKWDMAIDKVVDDEDFKLKLERHRAAKANVEATSNIRGDKSTSSAKDSPAYWVAKGIPPTREQVPDGKARAKIARAMMESVKSGKKFYSD
jgi:hypothetical protein